MMHKKLLFLILPSCLIYYSTSFSSLKIPGIKPLEVEEKEVNEAIKNTGASIERLTQRKKEVEESLEKANLKVAKKINRIQILKIKIEQEEDETELEKLKKQIKKTKKELKETRNIIKRKLIRIEKFKEAIAKAELELEKLLKNKHEIYKAKELVKELMKV